MSTETATTGLCVLVVPVTGDVRRVVLDPAGSALADLRRHVGCDLVEHVRGPGCDLWVDEEGAICDPPKPPNVRIDALLMRSDGWSIRGDVVVAGRVGPDGETRGLTSREADELMAWFGRVRL